MHTKMMNLLKVGEELEKEYIELKSQGPPMTEATKKQFIEEYRKSPELTEVMKQFGDGYQSAKMTMKERMVAACLDPHVLDSFDDEVEDEKDPPTA